MKRIIFLLFFTFLNQSLMSSDATDTDQAYAVFTRTTNPMVEVLHKQRADLPLFTYHDGASADENQAIVNAMYICHCFSSFEAKVKIQIALTQVVAFAVFSKKPQSDFKRSLSLALNFEHDGIIAQSSDSFEVVCAKCILFSSYARDEGIILIANEGHYAAADAVVTNIFTKAEEQMRFLKHMSSRSPSSTEASDGSSRHSS